MMRRVMIDLSCRGELRTLRGRTQDRRTCAALNENQVSTEGRRGIVGLDTPTEEFPAFLAEGGSSGL